jgi:signal transduction histidine kinase
VHLGLRARIVVVMAIISALTLAVAAVTLLSPLDRHLQTNALDNFAVSLRNERGAVRALDEDALRAGDQRLARVARLLARNNSAEVTILGPRGTVLASSDPDDRGAFAGVAAAARTGHSQRALTGTDNDKQAEVALPVRTGGHLVIVAARKTLSDSRAATAVVRRAFTVAAAAGLAGALLVGLLLASRLAGRILHLRDTALRVAEIGPDAELKPDRGRDEIGDLSRAFATMQERLREQERARRGFVATASHELRTPLASLSVMLDMVLGDLRARPADVEGATAQAVNAEAQVQRLSLLAGELLDLSRIDAGIPLRSEPVELLAVLESVAAELSVRLQDRPETIDLAGDAATRALGDPGSVAQILRVLLDNALRHNPAGARVTAEVAGDDATARVTVTDDGPGVAIGDRERIFERFARGADATDGGFGLGLAIGRTLARQMDGDLVLEEHAQGARFTLMLPVVAAASRDEPSAGGTAPAARGRTPVKP